MGNFPGEAARRSLEDNEHFFARCISAVRYPTEHPFLARRARLEHGRRVRWPGTIVECQHDFLITKKVVLLEIPETKYWTASRVDLNNA